MPFWEIILDLFYKQKKNKIEKKKYIEDTEF